ncbi:MAG TPA: hypothetical protein VE982_01885 [Gaiellaceae bacterium]|nr:hypothetical protein [Gaiellaceae bacterium]
MTKTSVAVGCACLAGLALMAGALASAGRGGATPAHSAVVVERDFHLAVSPTTVAAGTVVFHVQNHGPDAHELIVVRDHGPLPLRADGITIDEEKLAKQEVGGLEPAGAGANRTLEVTLAPGRYVLFCNMYGHYMGGMHAVVIAR